VHGSPIAALAANLRLMRTALILVTTMMLAGCSQSLAEPEKSFSSQSPTVTVDLQAQLDAAVEASQDISVTIEHTQVLCPETQTPRITSSTRLEAADVGELYTLISVGCGKGGESGFETMDVIHWTADGWSSVATIFMGDAQWKVTGACSVTSPTEVRCPVSRPKNETRPENQTLVVTRLGKGFDATIVDS